MQTDASTPFLPVKVNNCMPRAEGVSPRLRGRVTESCGLPAPAWHPPLILEGQDAIDPSPRPAVARGSRSVHESRGFPRVAPDVTVAEEAVRWIVDGVHRVVDHVGILVHQPEAVHAEWPVCTQ